MREGGKEAWRLRFSRTRRETRLWMQETPTHELHGSDEEFQEVRRELSGSAVDLRTSRGSTSGCSDAAA